MEFEDKINPLFWALRIGVGATAFLAGADKFTNCLTDWEKYVAPEAERMIPLSPRNFMRVVIRRSITRSEEDGLEVSQLAAGENESRKSGSARVP